MCSKGNHNWPRLRGPEQKMLTRTGTRTITTCNDCCATRVDIVHPDSRTVSAVVEPPEFAVTQDLGVW